MSQQLDYVAHKDSTTGLDFGTRSGQVNLQQPMYFDMNKKRAFRVIRCILSGQIPNIYAYGDFDNTTVRITRDGGTSWNTVQLTRGIYTVSQLSASINDTAIQHNWYTDPTDPAIRMSYNPATQYIYVSLDSTKLAIAGGQIGIDFSVSRIHEMFGYPQSASTFLVDGIHQAPNSPQMDVQGTYCDVAMSCIMSARMVNGTPSNIICRLPLDAAGQNEIVFPSGNTGMISPLMRANIPYCISQYSVQYLTQFGREVVFTMGNAILEVEVMDT